MIGRNCLYVLVGAVLAGGCSASRAPVDAAPAATEVPLFEGLGDRGRPVTTSSALAQKYFDQGLSFLYGFNHEEAIRSFRKAADLDPDCAMAWWGISVANGPHINNPVVPAERAAAAWTALKEAEAAVARVAETSPVERALVEALAARYADPQPEDRSALDAAYADAMREVWRRHPGDPDVGALYAEAMMDLRPWDLWTADGVPQPGTDEIVATLERVMELDPQHPLACHLYIHAVEASPTPGRADRAADVLRDLQPGISHLVHMPSHIDVRRGRWQEALDANAAALAADRVYRMHTPNPGFYGLYMAHNNHMLAYAAMMNGQREEAVRVIDAVVSDMPESWTVEYAPIADGYMVMPLEVRMRFGIWDEVLAAPDYAERFPFARAMRHYARGVAYAALGDVAQARAEQAVFLSRAEAVPAESFFGNNKASDLLLVAEDLLEGEILYREGRAQEAFHTLEQAIAHEDALRYDEPPSWIQPVRHALGTLLLKSGHAREAERVFRADLERLPENGWGLYGLTRSLEMQGEEREAAKARARFDRVWAKSDVEPTTACYCEPSI
jgi:tetratricopeptide (TPR) repeat protein